MIKTVFFILSKYCTVGCEYCYIPEQERNNKNFLSVENFEFILDKIIKFKEGDTNFNVNFFGGEPLELPLEYLKKLAEITKSKGIKNIFLNTYLKPLYYLKEENKKLYNEYIKFISNFNLMIGYSPFSNTKVLNNDKEKIYNYLLDILKDIRTLNDNSIINIDMLIHKGNFLLTEEIYKKSLGLKNYVNNIYFEHYYPYPRKNAKLIISNKEFSEFLIKMYELDKKNKIYNYHIHMKERIINSSKINQFISCDNCTYHYLIINQEGLVFTCFQETDNNSYGNILKEDIMVLLKKRKRIDWIKKQAKDFNFCKNCEFKYICSICPTRKRVTLSGDLGKITKNNCPGYYPFLKYLKNN